MSHLNRLVSLRSSFFSLSQIIFEPPADEDAQPIGLVEVRLCAGDAFHADLLCEMRQVLESLGLDVLASQPAGGAAALDADARCALLYAREAGGSLQVAASRRAQIRVALLELLSELQLSGAKLHVAGSEPPKLSAPFRARSRFCSSSDCGFCPSVKILLTDPGLYLCLCSDYEIGLDYCRN